jgi:erythronate-4-phosphate dehydrogenase
MANADFFGKMKFGAFFINTARGEIVDDDALLAAFPRLGPVIIDTWNNEPNVNVELISKASIATPHIAGYSYQGKQRATAAAVRAVARFFRLEPLFEFFPTTELEELEAVRLDLTGLTQGQITSVFQYNYPVFTDDFMFRIHPERFDEIRQEYRYRREFYI